MITQRFEFTMVFMKEWNNSVYFRLNKMHCEFKDQVRACPSGEKCGLEFCLCLNVAYRGEKQCSKLYYHQLFTAFFNNYRKLGRFDPVMRGYQEDTHSPDGQNSVSRIRPAARELGAAAGWLVRLTLGKPTTQLKWLRV